MDKNYVLLCCNPNRMGSILAETVRVSQQKKPSSSKKGCSVFYNKIINAAKKQMSQGFDDIMAEI